MTSPVSPRHIAFIMDGNGRWAQARGLARINGHERGADVLRDITRFCRAEGIDEVTFYALSTENYRRRPTLEIRDLMRLLKRYLIEERDEILEQRIRLRSIGRIHELPKAVVRELRRTEELSRRNDQMILRLALNYGSRGEILDAVKRIVAEIRSGHRSSAEFANLTEKRFTTYLYDPTMSDPDLVIRTAGEQRISNFLLWQISYAEIWICDEPWPEFTVDHLRAARYAYSQRQRKFGTVVSPALIPQEGHD